MPQHANKKNRKTIRAHQKELLDPKFFFIKQTFQQILKEMLCNKCSPVKSIKKETPETNFVAYEKK
jgi:hypothetical protein